MHKYKFFLIIIIAAFSVQGTISQNNTNSPYTRFGYGSISDNTSGEQRAMGGVAIGSRSGSRINTVNPASYSVSDSLTFMFDFGVASLLSNFSDGTNQKTKFTGNLEYLTLQFRLFKGVGLSAGILPYSFAGYDYYTNEVLLMPNHDPEVLDSIYVTKSYSGTGGINQFYLGLSFDLFNHFSLGANMYYMFGSYNNNSGVNFSGITSASTVQKNSISVSSMRFRVGAQFYNTFANKHEVTLGAIYEPKLKLNADARLIMNTAEEKDTLTGAFDFEVPQMFGIGLYYKYDNKWSLGFDYSLQQWDNTLFFSKKDLVNSSKFALGVEYQPNYKGRKFSDRIMYRFGANMSNPYYRVDNKNLGNNFGITFGVGFPLSSSSRTMINTTFEYGKVGSSDLLKEDYFKFTFNFALAETWFFKRKL